MSPATILLLIRQPGRIGECLSSIDRLCRSASKIQVVVLGSEPDANWKAGQFPLGRLQASGVECYTDAPAAAQTCGLRVVDKNGIAALLTRADVVIPL